MLQLHLKAREPRLKTHAYLTTSRALTCAGPASEGLLGCSRGTEYAPYEVSLENQQLLGVQSCVNRWISHNT